MSAVWHYSTCSSTLFPRNSITLHKSWLADKHDIYSLKERPPTIKPSSVWRAAPLWHSMQGGSMGKWPFRETGLIPKPSILEPSESVWCIPYGSWKDVLHRHNLEQSPGYCKSMSGVSMHKHVMHMEHSTFSFSLSCENKGGGQKTTSLWGW